MLIYVKKTLLFALGVVIILLGLVGMVFPVLPGIILLLLGISMLVKILGYDREKIRNRIKLRYYAIRRLKTEDKAIERLISIFF